MKMRYFSSVEGRAVPRFGTDTYIGCKREPGVGFVFDTAKIVAIPEAEVTLRLKDYRNAVKRGDLLEHPEPRTVMERAPVDDTVSSTEVAKPRRPKKEG